MNLHDLAAGYSTWGGLHLQVLQCMFNLLFMPTPGWGLFCVHFLAQSWDSFCCKRKKAQKSSSFFLSFKMLFLLSLGFLLLLICYKHFKFPCHKDCTFLSVESPEQVIIGQTVEETNILQVCDPLSILIAKSRVTGFGSMVYYLLKRDYRMGA